MKVFLSLLLCLVTLSSDVSARERDLEMGGGGGSGSGGRSTAASVRPGGSGEQTPLRGGGGSATTYGAGSLGLPTDEGECCALHPRPVILGSVFIVVCLGLRWLASYVG